MAAVMAYPESPRVCRFASPSRARDQCRVGAASSEQGQFDMEFDLDRVLVGSRDRVAQWCRDRTQSATADARRRVQELYREREQLEFLQGELASLEELTQSAAQQRKEAAAVGETLRETLDAAIERERTFSEAKERLRLVEGVKLQQVQETQASAASRARACDTRQTAVDRFFGLYKDQLGLSIIRSAPQTVRIALSRIDEFEASREFSFNLALMDGGEYSVSDCSTPVGKLDALLGRLNKDPSSTSALPAFVCGMRRAFQAVVAETCSNKSH